MQGETVFVDIPFDRYTKDPSTTRTAVNYQTTNGDNSTAIVAQYIDTSLGKQADAEYESTAGASYGGTSISNGGGGGGSGGGGGGSY